MNLTKGYMSRAEVLKYLNVSEWKLKKLIREDILVPDKLIKCSYGRNAYLFSFITVINVKRILKKEGYSYKHS